MGTTTEIITCFTWAEITFGNGSASAKRRVRVDDHASIPLCASFVDARVYLGDQNGDPIRLSPPPGTTAIRVTQPAAQVSALLSRGIRELPAMATHTVSNAPVTGPARLVSVSAYLTAAAVGHNYLQLFDSTSAPANGAKPVAEWPIGGAGKTSVIATHRDGRQFHTRPFANGIQYGVSSTSGVYTGNGAGLQIELEILDL